MSRRSWTLVAVVLGSAIVFLDSTIVNVALKAIGEQLPSTMVGVLEGESYVVNGYLLTVSALLILAGALADAYGRRRLFVIGLLGFGASSVLCGVAPNMELLIAGRVVQGIFGALLVPSSLAIITATFDGPERGRAFGIWAAASSATTVLGPPVGGFLVDTLSWRVAFLINVPLVVIAVAIALRYVAESRNEAAPTRFDWLGAAVVALAVGGLAFGAIRGQQQNWSRSDRLGGARHRRGRHRRPGAADGLPSRPAHPARSLPLAQLHDHERLDLPHLRGALRRLLVPGALPAGRAGVLGTRLGTGRDAHQSGACLPLDDLRPPRRQARAALVHGRRPGADGGGAAVADANPHRQRRVAGAGRGPRKPRAIAAATCSTSCRRWSSSGSASRSWWRR